MFIQRVRRLTMHACFNVSVFRRFSAACVLCVLCSAASVPVDRSLPQSHVYNTTSVADPCDIYAYFLCEQYLRSPALRVEQILFSLSSHTHFNCVPKCDAWHCITVLVLSNTVVSHTHRFHSHTRQLCHIVVAVCSVDLYFWRRGRLHFETPPVWPRCSPQQ